MTSIKVLPPTRLEEGKLSEEEFQIFQTELEVFLEVDTKYEIFMHDGKYKEWKSFEELQERIEALHAEDMTKIENDATLANVVQKQAEVTKQLKEIRRLLRIFISLVAKCVTKNQYNRITRQCTSLKSIYVILRKDYDIETRGIHFLNIIDLKYDDATMTPTGFHDQVRMVVTNNLAAGEKVGKAFEDFIFVEVLRRIDPRLPAHVKRAYAHKIGDEQRIHDFRHDIFVNLKSLKEEMEDKEQLASMKVGGTMSYMQTQPQRGGYGSRGQYTQPFGGRGRGQSNRGDRGSVNRGGANRGSVNRASANRGGVNRGGNTTYAAQKSRPPHCSSCYNQEYGHSTYNSHYDGDENCPSGSSAKLSHMEEYTCDEEMVEQDEANDYGPTAELKKVVTRMPSYTPQLYLTDQPRLGYIKPVPSQLMTVYQDKRQNLPIHLDLDSGANVSYVEHKEAIARGFKVYPNGQLSKLGDGNTNLPPVGEIHETFHRNDWTVLFRAIVTKKLVAPFVAGNNFTLDNHLVQDLNEGTISVHNGKHVIMDTRAEMLMPINPNPQVQEKPAYLQRIEHKLTSLLPGQTFEQPVKMENDQVVLVEGWLENDCDWPHAALCQVNNGKICLTNDTQEPIMMGKKGQVKTLKISKLEEHGDAIEKVPPDYYQLRMGSTTSGQGSDNTKKINFGKKIEKKVAEQLEAAHQELSEVFDESLVGGYNGYFGPHECRLNWVSKDRPQANKLKVANYDHSLNGLMQEVADELTRQGVLGDPQEMGITVQAVCPAFLKRKKRAKDKPRDQLTKEDMRLLINFGPINEKIKDVPTPMTTPEDIFSMLGRFKHIIVFDLYNGFSKTTCLQTASHGLLL